MLNLSILILNPWSGFSFPSKAKLQKEMV